MRAILSDIHGNLEALQAVLRDIEQHQVNEIYCLGDLIGYGPNPLECVELSWNWPVVLQGDHENFVLNGEAEPCGPSHPVLNRYLLWCRKELACAQNPRSYQDYLGALPHFHREGDHLYVHASPRNFRFEFIFPEDTYNQKKMRSIGTFFDRVCFCGHTHIAGIFEWRKDDWFYQDAVPNGPWFSLNASQTICNVGSVGQPRDNDPRASYVLFDGAAINHRRVDYDYEATRRKIQRNPDIDDSSGDRLMRGR
jgi:predicted phosphodiesterase